MRSTEELESLDLLIEVILTYLSKDIAEDNIFSMFCIFLMLNKIKAFRFFLIKYFDINILIKSSPRSNFILL